MAFKMRSGNKVSFKNMGGSPAKQSDGTINIDTELDDGSLYKRNTAKRIELENIDTEKRQLKEQAEADYLTSAEGIDETADAAYEKKGAYDEKNRKGNTLDDLAEKNKRKAGSTGWEEGDNVSDADTEKYKSKEQLNQDKKTNKKISKTNLDTQDRKSGFWNKVLGPKQYTDTEKKADKEAHLEGKLQREKGTGKSGFSFSLKNALIGDSLGAGLDYGAKHKQTQKKINKIERNEKDEKLQTTNKGRRKQLQKNENLRNDLNKKIKNEQDPDKKALLEKQLEAAKNAYEGMSARNR